MSSTVNVIANVTDNFIGNFKNIAIIPFIIPKSRSNKEKIKNVFKECQPDCKPEREPYNSISVNVKAPKIKYTLFDFPLTNRRKTEKPKYKVHNKLTIPNAAHPFTFIKKSSFLLLK